jgi:hypothetical protein
MAIRLVSVLLVSRILRICSSSVKPRRGLWAVVGGAFSASSNELQETQHSAFSIARARSRGFSVIHDRPGCRRSDDRKAGRPAGASPE